MSENLTPELKQFLANTAQEYFTMTRLGLSSMMLGDPRKDINEDCGYPLAITPQMYRDMYARDGISARVVNFFPNESWRLLPDIYETEDSKTDTPFEQAWKVLNERKKILHYLHRGDVFSGIGQYGVLLIGVNDNKPLDTPIDGVNDDENEKPKATKDRKLIYLRVFDEASAEVKTLIQDKNSTRFGFPETYEMQFAGSDFNPGSTKASSLTNKIVHWTRVLHIVDSPETSEVYGMPRMRACFNYLLNCRKILGGAAEMFWRGGFPGLSIETTTPEGKIDEVSMRQEVFRYFNGLDRAMGFQNMRANQLLPNIADPTPALMVQLNAICMTIGAPMRGFMGSEQGKLAADQDANSLDDRLRSRQQNYLTPGLVRPAIRRFQQIGVLPWTEEFVCDWPDLSVPSDDEKAKVLLARSQSFAQYMAGDVSHLIAPMDYLTYEAGYSQEEAEAIVKAAEEVYQEYLEAEQAMMDQQTQAEIAKATAIKAAQPKPAPIPSRNGA